jgi:hypothetical protein
VDIAEWTFAEPVVEIRQSSSKAPAKAADPFEGGVGGAPAPPPPPPAPAPGPVSRPPPSAPPTCGVGWGPQATLR